MQARTTSAHSYGVPRVGLRASREVPGAPLKAAAGRATAVKLQTNERDVRKAYASDAAAAFAIGWIADGLPLASNELKIAFLDSTHAAAVAHAHEQGNAIEDVH